jgi:two-component system NtrC family response regulator
MLANAFLRLAGRERRRRARFSADALQAMMAYGWPGNIRELQNKVSRAVIMAEGRVIEPKDLDLPVSETREPASLRESRDHAEREVLVEALSRHRGNISRAARALEVSRPTLHGLLDKHQVDAKSFR